MELLFFFRESAIGLDLGFRYSAIGSGFMEFAIGLHLCFRHSDIGLDLDFKQSADGFGSKKIFF